MTNYNKNVGSADRQRFVLDRLQTILLMREQRKSYRSIGNDLGLSGERIRQILQRKDYVLNRQKTNPTLLSMQDLSVRLLNCLKTAGCKTREDARRRVLDGSIWKVKNFGLRSYRELLSWLGMKEVKTIARQSGPKRKDPLKRKGWKSSNRLLGPVSSLDAIVDFAIKDPTQKCPVFVDHRWRCGLPLVRIGPLDESLEPSFAVYECAMGHKTYHLLEVSSLEKNEKLKTDRGKSNSITCCGLARSSETPTAL
jgi:hypothetical protein